MLLISTTPSCCTQNIQVLLEEIICSYVNNVLFLFYGVCVPFRISDEEVSATTWMMSDVMKETQLAFVDAIDVIEAERNRGWGRFARRRRRKVKLLGSPEADNVDEQAAPSLSPAETAISGQKSCTDSEEDSSDEDALQYFWDVGLPNGEPEFLDSSSDESDDLYSVKDSWAPNTRISNSNPCNEYDEKTGHEILELDGALQNDGAEEPLSISKEYARPPGDAALPNCATASRDSPVAQPQPVASDECSVSMNCIEESDGAPAVSFLHENVSTQSPHEDAATPPAIVRVGTKIRLLQSAFVTAKNSSVRNLSRLIPSKHNKDPSQRDKSNKKQKKTRRRKKSKIRRLQRVLTAEGSRQTSAEVRKVLRPPVEESKNDSPPTKASRKLSMGNDSRFQHIILPSDELAVKSSELRLTGEREDSISRASMVQQFNLRPVGQTPHPWEHTASDTTSDDPKNSSHDETVGISAVNVEMATFTSSGT